MVSLKDKFPQPLHMQNDEDTITKLQRHCLWSPSLQNIGRCGLKDAMEKGFGGKVKKLSNIPPGKVRTCLNLSPATAANCILYSRQPADTTIQRRLFHERRIIDNSWFWAKARRH